jgi:hypothetical protein
VFRLSCNEYEAIIPFPMLLLNTDDMVQEYKFGLEKLKEEQQ